MKDKSYSPDQRLAQELVCPKCKQKGLRREPKRGFLQTNVFPKLGFYPWECVYCRKVTLHRRRFPVQEPQASQVSTSQASVE